MGISASITLEDDPTMCIEETPNGETLVYTTRINECNNQKDNSYIDEPPAISEPYQPGAIVINQNEIYRESIISYSGLQPGQEFSPAPPLPFKKHPMPTMKNMSNKFRQYSSGNKMYPAKNGPIAIAKRLNIPIEQIPDIDPNDELLGDNNFMNEIKNKYMNDNLQLAMMGFENEIKNLRYLMKLGDVKQVIDIYLQPVKYEGILIGDGVIRGDHWKWRDQDGGNGLKGTVCGLRQWLPNKTVNTVTEVIVLWDHGLYGNYRYGYYYAYDVKVIHRLNIDRPISIGEYVERSKPNWRWKDQDGGYDGSDKNIGIVTELYANAPKIYEMDTIFAVLWDNEKYKYKSLAHEYMEYHPVIDNEFAFDEFDEKEFDLVNDISDMKLDIAQIIRNYKTDPHKVRKSAQMKCVGNNDEWDEPDFDEMLSKPVPQYRLSSGEVSLVDAVQLDRRKYLMVGDVIGGNKNYFFGDDDSKIMAKTGVVLKVEQQDSRRVDLKYIRGDKIWTSWSSKSMSFSNDGFDQIKLIECGKNVCGIKVGDRVAKGDNFGTVVCLQGIFKIDGIIGKVKWNKSQHINLYSWGYDNIYDIKKIEKQSNYESFLLCQSNESMDMYLPSAPVKEKSSVDEIECFDADFKPSAPIMDDDI